MKAAIIGGGIAGLTMGIALQKHNIDFDIFERAPQLNEIGAGIGLYPNALNVFQKLGFAEEILKNGFAAENGQMMDQSGKVLYRLDAERMKAKYGYPFLAIHRATLQKILAGRIRQASLHLNKELVSISITNEISFTDKTNYTPDLVIGADGINSRTRELIFGNIPLRYCGQTGWRGTVSFVLPEPFSTCGTEIIGNSGAVRFGFSKISDRTVYWFVTKKSEPNQTDNPETLKQSLLSMFKKFPPVVSRVIEATDSKNIIRTDLYDFKPIRTWYKNQVVLIGDAAHATTPNLGQGACQAIEDADCLASCLSKDGSIEEAFRQYQSARIKKATNVVNTSYLYAKLLNSGIGTAVFKTIFRFTPKTIVERRLDKILRV
jgi:2-polyprenyl-6-methoxyphenol hydroxylase-like FAD-dependent oxidoreductase